MSIVNTRAREIRTALLFATLFVGCEKGKPSSAPALASAEPAARAEAGSPAAARRPLTQAEKDAFAAYKAALARGRALTVQRRYADATTAFGDALKARPGDARALAERGFAELENRAYDAALADLDRARLATSDGELLGQIWFNIGLAREARHEGERAIAAFATSNELHPTALAAQRVAGKGECPADVDRTPEPGKVFDTWLDAFKGLWPQAVGPLDPAALPKSEAAARASMCVRGCDGAGPWLVRVDASDRYGAYYVVFPLDRGQILAFSQIGERALQRCSWDDGAIDDPLAASITLQPGSPAHVAIFRQHADAVNVRDGDGGTLSLCEDSIDGCAEACVAVDWESLDVFYDIKARRRLAEVRQSGPRRDDGHPPVRVTGAADGAHLASPTCDRLVRWSTPDAAPANAAPRPR